MILKKTSANDDNKCNIFQHAELNSLDWSIFLCIMMIFHKLVE